MTLYSAIHIEPATPLACIHDPTMTLFKSCSRNHRQIKARAIKSMINGFQYGHGSQDSSGFITSTQVYGYSGAMTFAFPATPHDPYQRIYLLSALPDGSMFTNEGSDPWNDPLLFDDATGATPIMRRRKRATASEVDKGRGKGRSEAQGTRV